MRQANLSIDIARRAWDVVHRLAPSVVPAENPWKGVERDTTKKTKPAATRAEAYALADALREMGEPHLGAAALICFEWLQRPERVLAGDITWADYRPADRPDAVQIRHHKTGVKGWSPLEDAEGPLYPELEAYLADLAAPRPADRADRGRARSSSAVLTRVCTAPGSRGASAAKLARPRHARRMSSWRHDRARRCRAHRARRDVALDAQDASGSAALCEAHRAPAATAARKRRRWVEENGLATKVGMERQTKSWNEQC